MDQYEALIGKTARCLLGHDQRQGTPPGSLADCNGSWTEYLSRRLEKIIEQGPQTVIRDLLSIGKAALDAFLQANVTGPPLQWRLSDLFPQVLFPSERFTNRKLQDELISKLSVDGEAVYQLIPYVELFFLAKTILNHTSLSESANTHRVRLRVNVWHQRLLNQLSSTLQDSIYGDLQVIETDLLSEGDDASIADFLIERASIHILHGFDAKAHADLEQAAKRRSFDYALTGRLGKRTKYQEKELSQLIVLAKSADPQASSGSVSQGLKQTDLKQPQALDLNDDTLLETISFGKTVDSFPKPSADDNLPPSLASLEPGNQPLLQPLDAIILLETASSITNTSPTDGLTREGTLPYAERVISGGSSNWQIYTQALLIRSRIEGYKSRTIERGVLQLQAVVDQVIAETTGGVAANGDVESARPAPNTFLPKSKTSESAPASERLEFIHHLASPPRWKLEAELADRWVSLGGLRTALEIYERLQMWAEIALCWAANDREDKAWKIIRRQLYNPVIVTSTEKLLEDDDDTDAGDYTIERNILPADAPRLFCILGDLEKSTSAYERAWEVSGHRYARAQRSLGKHYLTSGELLKADEAYLKSVKVNPQNHATWFALGSVRLQLQDWAGSVDAFGRAVQIDDTDAESWSNLAVALLKLSASETNRNAPSESPSPNLPNLETSSSFHLEETEKPHNGLRKEVNQQQYLRSSFFALKKAAALKRDSFKIWQNLLSVSVQMIPPPYSDIVMVQSRLIDLLGASEGERCIDISIVESLLSHIIHEHTPNDSVSGEQPRPKGLEKLVIDLIQKQISPLITNSRRLWVLVSKLNLHLGRPQAALAAYEKAWRGQLNQPGWDTGLGNKSKELWREVSGATIDLIDAYESLGERTREAGMGEGELVAKDWKFKARSAARTVLGRARDVWEDDESYTSLTQRLQDLKAG